MRNFFEQRPFLRKVLIHFKYEALEREILQELLQTDSFKVYMKTIGLGYRRFFWKHLSKHCIEWRFRKNEGMGSSSRKDELAQLFNKLSYTFIYPNQTVELQTINNISSSKSDLLAINSLDELVITNSQDLIPEITLDSLNKNLSHYESKIFHCNNQKVTCDLWSGEFTWHNNGGSHHFCAARYIARLLQKQIPLTVTLQMNGIDEKVYNELFGKYEVFLVSTSDADKNNRLQDILLNLRITFISIPLDFNYHSVDETARNSKLIAFYKDDVKARSIVELFKQCEMLDCKEYFSNLLKQQALNVHRIQGMS
ncbi:hypothetical protein HT667_04425 [Ursidibacter maritimus]|uniref:DUF6685 family protein n=1 Tax=Ursidibacter maritimus TaxID=1331689 RepID=UPI001C487A83|nr:DUF6685 family protein [Ursidibacter maritimus]MBV6540714.1 hypothetical protein [Ursidibacter maritimus]